MVVGPPSWDGHVAGRHHPHVGRGLEETGEPDVPHQHFAGRLAARRAEKTALGRVEGHRTVGGHGPGGDLAGAGIHAGGHIHRHHGHAPCSGLVDLGGPRRNRVPELGTSARAEQTIEHELGLFPEVVRHALQAHVHSGFAGGTELRRGVGAEIPLASGHHTDHRMPDEMELS